MGKHDRTTPERLAAIEVKLDVVCKQTSVLNELIPKILENSWWVGRLKWAFVFIAVVGVIGGIVTLAVRS